MAEPLQHAVVDLVQDDTASSKKRRQSRTYDTPCEGFSRTVDVPEKDRALFATDIKLAAFKECCKEWMAGPYPGVEVGNLATPWTTGQELRSTCVCCEHTECHSRNGTAFQLRGKTVLSDDKARVQVELSAWKSGSCGQTPRVLRADSTQSSQATVAHRKGIQRAIGQLVESKESVTPSHVARKLAAEGAAAEGAATPVNAASLRYFTKKLSPEAAQAHKPSQRTARKQQIIEVSLEAWQEYVREHSDGTKNLKFLFTTPHGSFVATLPPMLRELSRLHEQGFLRELYLNADATFDVEVEGFKHLGTVRYHVVTAGVHRLLKTQGRNGQDLWRRSGFPVMVARHPTERPEVYGRCLTALTAELQRLRLPHVSQIGTDWAPGLGRVVQASMPRCVWVPDMDHMFKNMSKTNLVEENGETVRVPRLKSRDIRVVQKYMDMLAMLPTTSLFLVTMRVFLDRMKNGWQEVEFHDFFVKQYLYKASVPEATFGVQEVLSARWYYGCQSWAASFINDVAQGQVCSSCRPLLASKRFFLVSVFGARQKKESRKNLRKQMGKGSVGKPDRMESPLVEQMWSHMQIKHLATLEEMLHQHGIIVETQVSPSQSEVHEAEKVSESSASTACGSVSFPQRAA
ncbi:unnamed protein product [Symbiodinium microadriaticum]|nr:unnamed protein product [Symbiodinium microadriaticum]